MGKDDLGDRMKRFERHGFGSEILLPQIPVIARLDGKTFHSFTRGLQKPFDVRLTELMHLTRNILLINFIQIWHSRSLMKLHLFGSATENCFLMAKF